MSQRYSFFRGIEQNFQRVNSVGIKICGFAGGRHLFLGEKVSDKFRAAIPKANSEKSFFSSSGNENLQYMLMNQCSRCLTVPLWIFSFLFHNFVIVYKPRRPTIIFNIIPVKQSLLQIFLGITLDRNPNYKVIKGIKNDNTFSKVIKSLLIIDHHFNQLCTQLIHLYKMFWYVF